MSKLVHSLCLCLFSLVIIIPSAAKAEVLVSDEAPPPSFEHETPIFVQLGNIQVRVERLEKRVAYSCKGRIARSLRHELDEPRHPFNAPVSRLASSEINSLKASCPKARTALQKIEILSRQHKQLRKRLRQNEEISISIR